MPDFSDSTNDNMQKFDSISHFIQGGNFQYRVFDMGRKVIAIDNQAFEAFENQELAYPYPFKQKAWLALLLWEEGKQHESVIWFLQFPIDELGFLKLQSRDAFLIELLEQTGKNIQAKQQGTNILDELKESPFAFKPIPPLLAIFHAFATRELGQSASKYYQHAHDYLTGETGFEQWQFLGLQGIADVIARLDQDNNEQLLIKALPQIQAEPREFFAQFLEHVSISDELFFSLKKCLDYEVHQENYNNRTISALLRGISGSKKELKNPLFLEILELAIGSDIEILVAISGRSWESLKEPALQKAFLEKLAENETQSFNAVLADLLMIPGMREPIFSILRNPERSTSLSQKLGEFMKVIKV